jgi:hypothetical protein
MKKMVSRGLAKISKSQQAEFEGLLGRLQTKYEVGLSMPSFDFSYLPFSITLGDRKFEVPLDDWGSGTKNRTLVLLTLFRARQIGDSEPSAAKITPVIIMSMGIRQGQARLFCDRMGFMARRQRVHLDAVPLHLVQRGHNREPCFFGYEDCFTYLHWPGEGLPFLGATDKARQAAYVTYSGIISTKKWSESCDWRSTKARLSGTSVSMRRLSARLGSVARRDREGGRA